MGIAYPLWVGIGRQAVLVLEAALPKDSGAFGRTPHGAPDREAEHLRIAIAGNTQSSIQRFKH